jgi:hypothetical protein
MSVSKKITSKSWSGGSFDYRLPAAHRPPGLEDPASSYDLVYRPLYILLQNRAQARSWNSDLFYHVCCFSYASIHLPLLYFYKPGQSVVLQIVGVLMSHLSPLYSSLLSNFLAA